MTHHFPSQFLELLFKVATFHWLIVHIYVYGVKVVDIDDMLGKGSATVPNDIGCVLEI